MRQSAPGTARRARTGRTRRGSASASHCSRGWGDTTWGHQVIPRIGMEALVSYQEGDPDRPFVTAIVPDPSNPCPFYEVVRQQRDDLRGRDRRRGQRRAVGRGRRPRRLAVFDDEHGAGAGRSAQSSRLAGVVGRQPSRDRARLPIWPPARLLRRPRSCGRSSAASPAAGRRRAPRTPARPPPRSRRAPARGRRAR